MLKHFKVMLCPNNKQNTKLFQCAGVARFAYNWALAYEQENYKAGNKFLSYYDLGKIFTKLKKEEQFKWLNGYSNKIMNKAIKDAVGAYQRFFRGLSKHPKFKSKKDLKQSFCARCDGIQFTETHVKLEKLAPNKKPNKQKFNWVRLAEHGRIPTNVKYYNPRVIYDGLHWWISVSVEYPDNTDTPIGEGIGIDLGIKSLAVCSDGNTYQNINKTQTVRKLNKRKKRLQRKVSKKYLKNKKGESFCKTKNIIKCEKELLKVTRRITNIRHNYLHSVTTEIVNRKPKFIVMEDLNVSGMLKNKYLARAIQEQCFYEFYKQIQYKCQLNNIKFIIADRFYPSSKTCSKCGYVKKDLKLSERVYECPVCHNKIDRDYQASINLKRYGELIS